MKVKIGGALFGLFLSLTAYALDELPAKKTLLQSVAGINHKSFDFEPDSWSCDTFVEFVKVYKPRRFNPREDGKRQTTFLMFEEIEKKIQPIIEPVLMDQSTWLDLELFAGKRAFAPYVGSAIDRTATEMGRVKLYWMLAQPTVSVDFLKQRQQNIAYLVEHEPLAKQLGQQFEIIKQHENIMISFWDQDHIKRSFDRHGFPIKKLNESRSILLAMASYMHVSNVVRFSVTSCATAVLAIYSFMRAFNFIDEAGFNARIKDHQAAGGFGLSYTWRKFERSMPHDKRVQVAFGLVSAAMCGLSLKYLVDDLHGSYLLDGFVHEIMHHVSSVIRAAEQISGILKQHPELIVQPCYQPLHDLFDSKDLKVIEFLSLMRTGTLKGKPSFFSHKGNILRSFFLMHEIKDKLLLAMDTLAELDVYCSFAQLYRDGQSERVKWCFAEYLQADKPVLRTEQFWHPMISKLTVVPNSLTIGNGHPENLVITGPNAGGKSTILKGLALSILLAQTIGVVPAERFALTPFSSIATYLNITDDIGSGNSLYKAEVLRVVELMKRIDNLKPGQFSFALFDEVFNGTSPYEGSAAAFSIVDDLAKKENSINIVATHFSLLTQLAEHNARIKNYKVSVVVHDDGTIEYPFHLEPGISQQHVAIDILRNEGVHADILDRAMMVLKNMKL